ncbi:hypothetical protein [Egbenema bharatensis]|uniref:hypothetical protein n=1 Tax=Egbenema bharatensis TaxID=3463334 RepID=UPI003A8890C6
MNRMDKTMTLEEILNLTETLSLSDKVRLLEQVAPQITRELSNNSPQQTPRKSLMGIWRGLDTIEAELVEARRGMWTNFPRRGV